MTTTDPAIGDLEARKTLARTLGDLYRSRGLLFGLLCIAVGLLLIIVAPSPVPEVVATPGGSVEVREPDDLLTRLRVYDIGVVVFQTGLVLAAFQVLLNQVAEDRFVEQVRLTLAQQEQAVQAAVARSLAASRSLATLELAPAELDRVIENASALRTGNPELGAVIARKLRTGVFESDEVWRNLVVRADIIGIDLAADSGRAFDYYDVYFQFSYHTNNFRRTRFPFKVARWQDEYDKVLRSAEFGVAWRLPSTGEFDDDWQAGFSLVSASFGGHAVPTQRNDVEREYVAQVPVDELEDRGDAFVQYSFNAKVVADGNVLSFEVPKPTNGANYSVSVGVDGIERLRAFDYFGSTRHDRVRPQPRPAPGHQRRSRRLDPPQSRPRPRLETPPGPPTPGRHQHIDSLSRAACRRVCRRPESTPRPLWAHPVGAGRYIGPLLGHRQRPSNI